MQFWPDLGLSLYGGWILLLIEWAIPLLALTLVSSEIRKRLVDRAHFSKKQKIYLIISKFFALTVLILILFTPLSLNSPVFYIGLVIFIFGIGCLTYALVNYIKTPLNEPVTSGMYRISRHPQDISTFFAFLGISLCIGSWIALIILFTDQILKHFRVLAEEDASIKQYGENYQEYMKKIPRYFLFF